MQHNGHARNDGSSNVRQLNQQGAREAEERAAQRQQPLLRATGWGSGGVALPDEASFGAENAARRGPPASQPPDCSSSDRLPSPNGMTSAGAAIVACGTRVPRSLLPGQTNESKTVDANARWPAVRRRQPRRACMPRDPDGRHARSAGVVRRIGYRRIVQVPDRR